jgi:hypothetical protein
MCYRQLTFWQLKNRLRDASLIRCSGGQEMQPPLIAVVGDANKSLNPVVAKTAAEDLGRELARRGSRILLFSSDPTYIEDDIVRGYLGSGAKTPANAIQVRYPPSMHRLFSGEKEGDERFDRQPQGKDWEVSFYPWLSVADGIVLIGGGYTTRVAGLIAIGSKTPIVTLGGLGGAAEDVLEYLRQARHSIATEAEVNLMARPTWGSSSASHCVDALLEQTKRKQALNQQTEFLKSESKRVRGLTILATVGSLLFVAVLLAIAEAMHSDQTPRWVMWILFGAPAAAGASGAAIRGLWDHYSRQEATGAPLKLRPIGMTISLGFWASGVAGALFLLPQIVSMGQLQPSQAFRLLSFSSLVGLLAGLTLDRVFPRLIKIEVPIESASLGMKGIVGKNKSV